MRRLVLLIALSTVEVSFSLPRGFVYLKDIAPDIEQDIRYATSDNFVGRPIDGYQAGKCILTQKAALALKHAQQMAQKLGYGLKVYDCYRPQRAVQDFYRWSQKTGTKNYSPNFYPRVKKSQLFQKGYIARHSGHSRGSTVDLTLIAAKNRQIVRENRTVGLCYASTPAYLNDNSVNMATRFDCLDPSAHFNYPKQSKTQYANRKKLRKIMHDAGFNPYHKEWWHFSLNNEPYPRRYFNFPVK